MPEEGDAPAVKEEEEEEPKQDDAPKEEPESQEASVAEQAEPQKEEVAKEDVQIPGSDERRLRAKIVALTGALRSKDTKVRKMRAHLQMLLECVEEQNTVIAQIRDTAKLSVDIGSAKKVMCLFAG